MPTGTGKTVVFANLLKHLERDRPMLVLAHREELIDQSVAKIRHWNPSLCIGVEMASQKSSKSDDVVVASVQSIVRRLHKFSKDEFSTVICDEVHHSAAATYQAIFKYFGMLYDPAKLLVGFTATPNRADGVGLCQAGFQKIVFDMSLLNSIKDGWLADLKAYRIRTKANLDKIHIRAGELAQDELSSTVNTSGRNALIVKEWLKIAEDRQTIAFTVDIAHAINLAAMFQAYGVKAQAIWGSDPDRREKLADFRAGHISVLCNCNILTEGFDAWEVGCVIMARPTKSQPLFEQCIGRGLRIPEGINNLHEARANGIHLRKDDCILLDVVDQCRRHNLATLPSLFGLGNKLDMNGQSVTKVIEDIERAEKAKPSIDPGELERAKKVDSFVEKINLFDTEIAPEVIYNSKLQWHRTRSNDYVLLLENKESLCLIRDDDGNWHESGTIGGERVHHIHNTFEAAIRSGDLHIQQKPGIKIRHIVNSLAEWRNRPPTPNQLSTAKRMGIVVPGGATSGLVTDAISKAIASRKGQTGAEEKSTGFEPS